MATKLKTPAPIDRPLSRAYLRQFSGWSPAYPPGLSDPTSMRLMENVYIGRDGSAIVRPGLRYLSYTSPPTDAAPGVGTTHQLVGTHEAFFLNDGSKAYLFAVREDDGTVGFRVLSLAVSGSVIHHLTDTGIDFDLPMGEAAVNFSAATTYVKYLQIDNKVFALSNAGEPMRIFHVGAAKLAKPILPITRPDWSLADKLTVVEPDAAWINAGLPIGTRWNLLTNPSFEDNRDGGTPGDLTAAAVSDEIAAVKGHQVLKLQSKATRTNLMTAPLHDVASTGITGWTEGPGAPLPQTSGSYMLVLSDPGGGLFFARGPALDVTPGADYRVAYDTAPQGASVNPKCRIRWYGSNGAQIGSDLDLAVDDGTTRWVSPKLTAPAGAVTLRVFPGGKNNGLATTSTKVKNVLVYPNGEGSTFFSGASGTNYFWTGTANASSSVYHPPVDVSIVTDPLSVSGGEALTGSMSVRSAGLGRAVNVAVTTALSGGGFGDAYNSGSSTNDTAASWTRLEAGKAAIASGATTAQLWLTITAVPRGEAHYVDAAMLEPLVTTAGTYFDATTPDTPTAKHGVLGTAAYEIMYSAPGTVPDPEAKTADTLRSSNAADNDYNFAFFYTFSNEVGESAASQVTTVRCQRAWSAWRWETPNAAGEPSGTDTNDPEQAADQLVAVHVHLVRPGLGAGHRAQGRHPDADPGLHPRRRRLAAGHPGGLRHRRRALGAAEQGQPLQLLRPLARRQRAGRGRPDDHGARPDERGGDPLVGQPAGRLLQLHRQQGRRLQDADVGQPVRPGVREAVAEPAERGHADHPVPGH
jgi:hypothetical protein